MAQDHIFRHVQGGSDGDTTDSGSAPRGALDPDNVSDGQYASTFCSLVGSYSG
ncbi:MAG: hypothetical protein IPJ55_09295 [Chloracidobacterium sp.]|nr:hypothetical protein [Chloracidobacterium sp.]